jgi:hypothetical protein
MVEAEGNPTTWKFTQYVPLPTTAIPIGSIGLPIAVLASLLKSFWERH